MKLNKKIVSLVLVFMMVLSTSSAFAANGDIVFKSTKAKYATSTDAAIYKNTIGAPVAINRGTYLYEHNENYYSIDDLFAAYAEDTVDFLDILEDDYSPVAPVIPPVTGDLKVEEVSAINGRQIRVEFNKEVLDSATGHGALNLSNYYIGIKEDIGTSNFTAINGRGIGTGIWSVDFEDDTNKAVIFTSTAADETLLVEDPTTTNIRVQADKDFTFEVRNVYDANGNGMDNQQLTVKAIDTTRPTVKLADDVINTGDTTLVVEFSEPVLFDIAGTTTQLDPNATVYLDNAPIALTATAITDETGTFDEAREVTITVPALTKGTHKLSIVGAKDLGIVDDASNVTTSTRSNMISPNPTTITFEVKDGTAQTQTKPTLLDIVQVDDNAFLFVFDKGIDLSAAAGPVGVGEITIKNADGQNGDKVVDLATLGTDTFVAAPARFDDVVEAVDEDAEGYVLTLVNTTNVFTSNELSFNNANILFRKFVVENFETDDATVASKNGLAMDKKELTIEIVKDIQAPTLADKEVAANNLGFDLTFVNEPFNDTIVLDNTKTVIVKATVNGITYTDNLTGGALTLTGDVLNVDLTDGTELVKTSPAGELLPNTTYTIILPDALVRDEAETSSQGTPADGIAKPIGDNLDPARPHAFVGKTITIKTDGSGSVTEVPQISQAEANAYNVTVPGTNTKNIVKIEIKGANIAPATVRKVGNYKIDGAAMPAGTTVDYTEENSGVNKYLILEIPNNSIELDGEYNLNISNIATEEGYKMLPVTVKVKLEDNTSPTLQSATITSSNTLKLRFDEGIDTIADEVAAGRNFIVNVNGTNYEVASAEVDTVDQYINIVTSSNFDVNGVVKVTTQEDNNGNIHVYDQANKANKMATGITKTAVKDL